MRAEQDTCKMKNAIDIPANLLQGTGIGKIRLMNDDFRILCDVLRDLSLMDE
jgi:hypothetical protein